MTTERTEIPEGRVLCPACRGEGEYGGETRYQPVEGMAYMDVPRACPYCSPPATWANYPNLGPRGHVPEDQADAICAEIGVCRSCHGEIDGMALERGAELCRDCYADDMSGVDRCEHI